MTPRNYKPQRPGHISLWFILVFLGGCAYVAWNASDYFKGTLQPTGYMTVQFR